MGARLSLGHFCGCIARFCCTRDRRGRPDAQPTPRPAGRQFRGVGVGGLNCGAAEGYGGSISVAAEDGVFAVAVTLPIAANGRV